ncbi:MAG TPA: UDP-3-O-(3-hydroxymyristoyl)glucosamine N-acyltransferase [bacterium]|nr:UDP-3-O-(3-hydroxymyristoyl)glucosamine N-acyltransferase [bacterium]HPR88735.1 UDP-3-O-(3-hydroxymyristoyl)glucosamine N-acyltransferase [bacterium]
MAFRLAEIASWIGAVVDGDETLEITGLAKIEEAQPGQLTFIANPKYEKYIQETAASAVLVADNFPGCGKTLLRCSDPYYAFLQLVERLYGGPPALPAGIHPSAVIGAGSRVAPDSAIGPLVCLGRNCVVGARVQLHPGVVLGDEVQIGDDTILYANVSVRERCRLGDRVIVHCGAVIGSDGFGFAFKEGRYHKIPQTGIVIVEEDVEIGANTTIDRATLGATVIHAGVKLDNLIQVAHNVEIGCHTAIAAQAGISGSSKVGTYVRMGGQVGISGHLHIGDNVILGGQAGVTKDIPAGVFYSGYPARPHMQAMREEAGVARLPELLKRIKQLEKQVEALSRPTGGRSEEPQP